MSQTMIIGAIVSTAISTGLGMIARLLQKPTVVEGPRLNDLTISDSAYGKSLVQVWGTGMVPGNIIFAQDLTETKHEEDEGGKGGFGGGGASVITYTYSCSFAVAWCKGEVIKILKRWADTKLLTDNTGTGVTNRGDRFNTYYGSDSQNPDPIMEDIKGAGEVPAHRGMCYDSFDELELADFSNRIPNLRAEVSRGATPPTAVTRQQILYTAIGGNITSITDIRVVRALGFYVARSDDGFIRVQTSNDTQVANGFSLGGIWTYASSNIHDWDVDESGNVFVLDYMYEPPSTTVRLAKLKSTTMTGTDYVLVNGIGTGSTIPTKICTAGLYVLLGFEGVNKDDGHTYSVISVYDNGLNHLGDAYFQDKDIIGFPWAASMTSASSGTGWFGIAIGVPMTGGLIYVSLTGPTLGHISVSGEMITGEIDLSGDISATPTAIVAGTQGIGIVCDDDKLYPWELDYDEYSWWLSAATVGTPIICGRHLRVRFPNGGKVWVQKPSNLYHYEISLDSWAITRSAESAVFQELTDSYDPTTDAIYSAPDDSDASVFKYLMGRSGKEGVSLADILSDISQQVGLTAGEIDVSQVEDTVRGYILNEVAPARTAIEILKSAFFFDVVESDNKVCFIPRNPTTPKTVTVIPSSDLGAFEHGGSPAPSLEIQIEPEIDFPREVNVQYINRDSEYEQGNQRDRRLVSNGQAVETYSFSGLVMTDDDARQVAEVIMNVRWMQRVRYFFQVSRKYLKLNPTDLVQITENDITHTILLLRTEYGGGGIVKCYGVADDKNYYVSLATGNSGDQEYDDFIPGKIPTIIYYLDIPILRDQDDGPCYYIAACGVGDGWKGCIVYKSGDLGFSYTKLCSVVTESAIGFATTALSGNGLSTTWDEVNTLTVKMISGTPGSTSDINVLNGANAAVLGSDGRWEVIQWTTATLNGDGTYTLSRLLRGRKGTEWAMDLHAVGDKFIILSPSSLVRVAMATDEIGTARSFKAVTLGDQVVDTPAETFTPTAVGLHPYSPVHIEGSRDGSNNLTITAYRRTRVGGAWRDFVDASLGEASEEYEVDIIADDSAETVLRTISGLTSLSAPYTAAQQTTDGLTPGDPVTCRWYQISETVGRGYAGEATV